MYKIANAILTFAFSFLVFDFIISGDVSSENSETAPITDLAPKVLAFKNSYTLSQAVLKAPLAAHSTATTAVERAKTTVVRIQNAAKIEHDMLIQENTLVTKDWLRFSNNYWLQKILLFESNKSSKQSIGELVLPLTVGLAEMNRLTRKILPTGPTEITPVKLEVKYLSSRAALTENWGQMYALLELCSDKTTSLGKS
jgi:hypothetical protein